MLGSVKRHSTWLEAAAGIIGLIPVAVYYWYVNHYSFNFFYADDFHLFKDIVWAQETPDWWQKLRLLFQQHNEHRIVVPRLLTWLDYQLEGSINWRTLIGLGNLVWLGILVLLYQRFRRLGVSLWYFVPIPFVLLQPQYVDNLTWTISIFQQCLILGWAFWCIYLITSPSPRWWAAAALALVATFTHGNGMFVFLVGGLLWGCQRRWKILFLWTLLFVLTLVVYFTNYQAGQNSNLSGSLANPLRLVGAWGAFAGAYLDVFKTHFFAPQIVVGLSTLLLILGVSAATVLPLLGGRALLSPFRRFYQHDQGFLIGCGLFMVITALLVAVSRSWGGLEAVVQSRYQHFAVTTLCLAYLILLHLLGQRWRPLLLGTMLSFGLIFNALSYFQYTPEVAHRQAQLRNDVFNWQHHRLSLQYPAILNDNFREVLQKSFDRHICQLPPSSSFDWLLQVSLNTPRYDTLIRLGSFDTQEHDASGTFARHYLSVSHPAALGTVFVVLKSATHTYVAATQRHHAGRRAVLAHKQYWAAGFEALILSESVRAGQYQVGYFDESLGVTSLRWSPVAVTIPIP